jgi:Periplasmic copper-binding protein (NosD)
MTFRRALVISCIGIQLSVVLSFVGADVDVRDFGAIGNAVCTTCSTEIGSDIVLLSPTNAPASVGQWVQLFGAGNPTRDGNHEDLVTVVRDVSKGTNLQLALPAMNTLTNARLWVGAQNSFAFQAAVDAASVKGGTVRIPAGKYLLIPPDLTNASPLAADRGYELRRSVTVSSNGLRFVGDGPATSWLVGNGAWRKCSGQVQRGMLFFLRGPVSNTNGILSFENLTFDGGVAEGHRTNFGFPASPITGDGWDVTHGALLDIGSAPMHPQKIITNCWFTHWRGEILKSVVGNTDGHVGITHCRFEDGNASAFNFSFTHEIRDSYFEHLRMAMEFYQGWSKGWSQFANNTVSNVNNGIVLVGARKENDDGGYFVVSNRFYGKRPYYTSGQGIQVSAAKHCRILGNRFEGFRNGFCVAGAGYQGTDRNRDIVVAFNEFTNCNGCVSLFGSGQNATTDCLFATNTSRGQNFFAMGYGEFARNKFVANQWFGGNGFSFEKGTGESPLIDSSNTRTEWCVDLGPGDKTGVVIYGRGPWQCISGTTNSLFVLSTNHLPACAELTVRNRGSQPLCVYRSGQANFGVPDLLGAHLTNRYLWVRGQWR